MVWGTCASLFFLKTCRYARGLFSCRRGTGVRGAAEAVHIPFILPGKSFCGKKGGRGGKGGGFLQKAWQQEKRLIEGASYLDLFKNFLRFQEIIKKNLNMFPENARFSEALGDSKTNLE